MSDVKSLVYGFSSLDLKDKPKYQTTSQGVKYATQPDTEYKSLKHHQFLLCLDGNEPKTTEQIIKSLMWTKENNSYSGTVTIHQQIIQELPNLLQEGIQKGWIAVF